MVYGSSKNLLEDMIENTQEYLIQKMFELRNFKMLVVMMKNFADDYTGRVTRCETLFLLFAYTTILTKSIQLKTKNP